MRKFGFGFGWWGWMNEDLRFWGFKGWDWDWDWMDGWNGDLV